MKLPLFRLKQTHIVLLISFLLWIVLWVLLTVFTGAESYLLHGTTINQIFLIIILVLLSISLLVQRSELKEIKESWQRQGQLMTSLAAGQNALQTQSRFDYLLQSWTSSLRSIKIVRQGVTYSGRDSFTVMFNILVDLYKKMSDQYTADQTSELIREAFGRFEGQWPADLQLYFQNLLHLLQFIDKIEEPDKSFFVETVRCQLSTAELLLIFYYCIGSKSGSVLGGLIKKMKILKNLSQDMIDAEHLSLYQN